MTAVGATLLPGAQGRLLPLYLPFTFFGAAILFHVAGWAVLLLAAEQAPFFAGGLGPLLAALHLITIGVLTLTGFGAAFQLLPVATRQPLAALWPIWIVLLLMIPGIPLLVAGMALFETHLLAIGGTMTVAGMIIAGVLLALNLAKTRGMPVVIGFAKVAVFSLFAVLTLGLSVTSSHLGFGLEAHRTLAILHVVIGGFGFMGCLAIGFSYVLVPMFGLSPPPRTDLGLFVLAGAILGIVSAAAGIILAWDWLILLGVVAGLLAVAGYLVGMAQAMKHRMKKRLGVSFQMIRLAWILLPVSVLIALGGHLGLLGDNGPALVGFTLFFGWQLTFVLGVLQRILPFLASMHAAKAGGQPPLVSEMSSQGPMSIHAGCHIAALGLVAGGIAAGMPDVVRAGAIFGLAGGIIFAWFGAQVIGRMLRRRAAGRQASKAEMAYE